MGFKFLCFWAVRGLGETIYWLNQQFSTVQREKPEYFWYYRYVENDSVFFINQIVAQCLTVLGIIGAIWFGYRWIHN